MIESTTLTNLLPAIIPTTIAYGNVEQSFPIQGLPEELLLSFFYYLGELDLTNCSLVCNQWSRLSQDEFLWKDLFRRRFGLEFSQSDLSHAHDIGLRQVYRNAYQNQNMLHNIVNGIYTLDYLDGGGSAWGTSIEIKIVRGKLISLFSSGIIVVYDLNSSQSPPWFFTQKTPSLTVEGKRFAVRNSSEEGVFIDVYEIDTDQLSHSIKAYRNGDSSLCQILGYYDGLLFVSYKCMKNGILILDAQSGEYLDSCLGVPDKTLVRLAPGHYTQPRAYIEFFTYLERGHQNLVLGNNWFSIDIDNNIIITKIERSSATMQPDWYDHVQLVKGIDDKKFNFDFKFNCNPIYTYSTEGEIETVTIKSNESLTASLVLSLPKPHLAIDAPDQVSYNLATANSVLSLEGHNDLVTSIQVVNDELLISSSLDGTVKAWNKKTGECLLTYNEAEGMIYDLAYADGKLYSSENFFSGIRIRNFNTSSYAVLAQIATLFMKDKNQPAMDRFNHLPEQEQKGVYWETYNNFRPQGDNDPGFGKHIFHDEATSLQNKALAIHNHLLRKLAYLFKVKPDDREHVMKKFMLLPVEVRGRAYYQMYLLLKRNPDFKDYPNCGEHAFHDQYGLSSTPEEKAEALENCLK